MKDLEQLEKQNKDKKGGNNIVSTPMRKKNFTTSSSTSERKAVNYEDKIKEL